ncbi:ATP-dependent DNA helicase UvrD2 [Hoyosella sp. YIM 151337]|uniref:ATP-dependent helicase n=1 Tax=Hoyosella sp. YIM 151337 TaxID=2992742 RepID=UPI00223622DB|nr:ATP-dependent DNA helicase UvrD2 [Hoyosella sp. YIM 151337]MCW4352257.1 ATP-dependent DNA helicase UvrD2 [Hoyosella sp. YIM 151337]
MHATSRRSAPSGRSSATDLLEGLDPEQRAAVVAPRGPVCVLAGAGTGKTRTVTRRIAHLVTGGHVAANQVLAVTFTSRAAGEMRTRLRELGAAGGADPSCGSVQARTFHAAALRQLRYFWPRVIGDSSWQLLDRKFPAVRQAAQHARASTDPDSVRDFAAEIEWAKSCLIAPDDYAAAIAEEGRDSPAPPEIFTRVYQNYEQLKVSGDTMLLDFDDLLIFTAAALEENAVIAEEFRDRYRSFLVDEYQDVTPLQQRLLDTWLGARDDLTVVGDANQTIYSFTGASPAYLLNFSRRFPEATVVRLVRDYRSTPEVVTLANRVIGAAKGRIAGMRLDLIGQRPSGPDPEFVSFDDEVSEAAGIAGRVKKLLQRGVPASEIAILFRINAQSEVYEEALTEAGISFQVRGGEGFFSRSEIKQAMSALRAAAERNDLPGDAMLSQVVRAVLAPIGLTESPPAGQQARERWESLAALERLADDLAETHEGLTLRQLAGELDERAASRQPPVVDGVTLASLHAAKGLEWDAVFLAGLTDGTLPISHALGDRDGTGAESAIEEERRLFYVGVTRAREHLTLTWALARGEGGRKTRKPSRFLTPLLPADAVARSKGGTGAKGVQKSSRDTLDSAGEDRFERLRAWRLEKARELNVPAYVVFTDATLTAIAARQPADNRTLGMIPGIGAAKLERFGADVLTVVNDSVRQR